MTTAQPPQESDDPLTPFDAVLPLSGVHVLLAEDCVALTRLYIKFFKRAGAEVTLECNGQSAVEAVRKSPESFDVIVMDFQMPQLDGLGATRQLRELGFDGPIIAVTARNTYDLQQDWIEAGCNDFIEKPLNERGLITEVARHARPASAKR